MNIGIDIDNTITEIQEKLNKAKINYAIKLGKSIDKKEFNYEEQKYFLKNIQEKITDQAKPRKDAVEIINKLRKEGYKIIIITARCSEFHDNPYLQSKEWLEKNNIEYDKLIVNAIEKGSICKEENIDIFIDDQLDNCLAVLKQGIKVIGIGEDFDKGKGIVTVENWKQIDEQIREWSK